MPRPRFTAVLALLTAALALPAATWAQQPDPRPIILTEGRSAAIDRELELLNAEHQRFRAELIALLAEMRDLQARVGMAERLIQQRQGVEAYRLLEPMRANFHENLEFQLYLGIVAMFAAHQTVGEQDPAAARVYYEAAAQAFDLALTPSGIGSADAASLTLAIGAYGELGRTERALAIARQATDRFPRDAVIWSRYAQILSAAGQHREAVAAYDHLLRVAPAHPRARLQRARAQLELGEHQAALSDFAAAAAAGEGETVSLILAMAGMEALRAGRFEEASDMLEIAGRYASGERRLDVNFFHGVALYRQGESIARANTGGDAGRARRALELFRRAEPLVRDSQGSQRETVLNAIRQFIEHQEAVLAGG